MPLGALLFESSLTSIQDYFNYVISLALTFQLSPKLTSSSSTAR